MLSTVYILMVSDKEVVCTSTKPFLLQSTWKICYIVLYQGHIEPPLSAPKGYTMYKYTSTNMLIFRSKFLSLHSLRPFLEVVRAEMKVVFTDHVVQLIHLVGYVVGTV